MPTIIPVTCEKCGTMGDLTIDANFGRINVAGNINVDIPCTKCGGQMSAPSGDYQKNKSTDRLERLGDFQPRDE